jgi:hypothetical protein
MNNEQKLNVPTEIVSPAAQASVNQMISAAVAEVFKNMGPMLERISLTPEKLAEAERLRREPDPKLVAREARERALMREDLRVAEKLKRDLQESCTHKDNNMRWSISAIHNYPDRQCRLICVRCHLIVEPTHWTIDAPDATHPRGVPRLVPAHPRYAEILADVNAQTQSV